MKFLAIDLGGTAVKMGLVDDQGRIEKKASVSVAFDGYRTPIQATAVKAAKVFLRDDPQEIDGVAVSACGQIYPAIGMVIGTNGRIPNYEGTNLKAEMEQAFGKETWVLNDANAAVLGECFAGRAIGLRDVILVTLGTGVGGGIVSGPAVPAASGDATNTTPLPARWWRDAKRRPAEET